MRPKQPPKVATWMLKHFGSGPNIESILGDLAEQHQQNSSAARYWRQALTAIPVSFLRDIRAHKWSVAKALMTGWVLWILAASLIFPIVFYDPKTDANAPQVRYHIVWSDPRSVVAFMSLPAIAPARHDSEGHRSTLDALLFAMALPAVAGAISGWFAARWQVCVQANPATLRLGRVQRDRQTSVVLIFACSVLVMNLLPFAFLFGIYQIPFMAPLLTVNAVASVLGVLLGGGLFRDRSRLAGT